MDTKLKAPKNTTFVNVAGTKYEVEDGHIKANASHVAVLKQHHGFKDAEVEDEADDEFESMSKVELRDYITENDVTFEGNLKQAGRPSLLKAVRDHAAEQA